MILAIKIIFVSLLSYLVVRKIKFNFWKDLPSGLVSYGQNTGL